jgi:hypothetical protein
MYDFRTMQCSFCVFQLGAHTHLTGPPTFQGFDTETLWEQLQLRNPAVQKFVQRVIRRLEEQGEALMVLEGGDGASGSGGEEEEEEDEDEEEEEEENEEENEEGTSADEDARFEQVVGGEDTGSSSSNSSSSSSSEEESKGNADHELDDEEEQEEEGDPEPDPEPERRTTKAGRKQQLKQQRQEEDEEDGEEGAGPSKLNDGFFDWNEMERFADEAEQEEFGGACGGCSAVFENKLQWFLGRLNRSIDYPRLTSTQIIIR